MTTIDTSGIDATKPEQSTDALTSDLRSNLSAIKTQLDSAWTDVATKAEAEALSIVEGKKIFITSTDGGNFIMKSGASAGTYNDNGGAYTGTKFTAGDGSSGFERDFDDVVYPEWFGAAGDADKSAFTGTDDTTALQNAMSSGYPVKLNAFYKITDALTMINQQIIRGIGRAECGLVIPSGFNLSAVGVLTCAQVTEPGPDLSDFSITFYQDLVEIVRANIIQYPPAIDLATFRQPRLNINNMRISKAYDGIDLTGNNGGAHITNLELCALNKGIITDGALDFIFLDGIESWVFDMTGSALAGSVFQDGNTIAAELANCDALVCNNFAAFNSKIIVDGGFGLFSQLSLDGDYANIEFLGGARYGIGTLYSTSGVSDDFAIKVSGTDTQVTVGTMWIGNATDLTASNGLIQLLTDASAELVIGEIHAKTSGTSTRLIYQTEGILVVNGGFLHPPQNATLLNDFIDINGGRASIGNLQVKDKGTGTGNLIGIASDNRHSITNVIAPGWPISLPASSELMQFSDNDFDTKYSGTRRLVATMVHVLTDTLDGSGIASVAHGLSIPHSKYPVINGWDSTGGGVRTPLDITSVGGTNVAVSSPSGAGHSGYDVEIVIMVTA